MLLMLPLASCATMFSENQYAVSVVSEPSAVKYEVLNADNEVIASGVTPNTVALSTDLGWMEKPRYKIKYYFDDGEVIKKVKSEISNAYIFGNLFNSFIGYLIVDPLTGSMHNLPEKVNANESEVN